MKFRTIMMDPPWYEAGGGKIKRGADHEITLNQIPEELDYSKNK